MDKHTNVKSVEEALFYAHHKHMKLVYLLETEPNDSELGRKVRELFKK